MNREIEIATSEQLSHEREKNLDFLRVLEKGRSNVRRYVTYIAAGFLFGGGILLLAACFFAEESTINAAKDIYTGIAPIATGIVTYWFADRSRGKAPSENAPSAPPSAS